MKTTPLLILAALLGLLCLPTQAEKTAKELMGADGEAAVNKGLRWLANKQIKRGADRGAMGKASYSGTPGIAGLAGLAFMCQGSTPGIGRYGKEVKNAVDFVVNSTSDTGYIAGNGGGHGNMYAHGFATLFLSQSHGMTDDERAKEALQRSVGMLIEAQNDQGGWRYQPSKSDADLSVTVCQIMALRGARDAGLNVPDATRQKCIEYVKKSNARNGSFSYTLGYGGGGSFALTAAGLVSLYSAGIYEGKMIENGLTFLERGGVSTGGHYYFYGHYYSCQAFWHAGGDRWEKWYKNLKADILSKQKADGSWSSNYGSEFGTAMACIILQMPKDMVPVFAR